MLVVVFPCFSSSLSDFFFMNKNCVLVIFLSDLKRDLFQRHPLVGDHGQSIFHIPKKGRNARLKSKLCP